MQYAAGPPSALGTGGRAHVGPDGAAVLAEVPLLHRNRLRPQGAHVPDRDVPVLRVGEIVDRQAVKLSRFVSQHPRQCEVGLGPATAVGTFQGGDRESDRSMLERDPETLLGPHSRQISPADLREVAGDREQALDLSE
jgi:hypothetical protein